MYSKFSSHNSTLIHYLILNLLIVSLLEQCLNYQYEILHMICYYCGHELYGGHYAHDRWSREGA